MNQTFSFSRFAQLNRWFWAANGQTYSLTLIVLLIITSLLLGRVLAITGYDVGIARNNIPYFFLLTVPVVAVLANNLFSVLHDQNSSILYLMLPASRTEKFAVTIMYLLLFMVGYSLFYVAVEALFFQLANSRLPTTGNLYTSELLSEPKDRLLNLMATMYGLLLTAAISLLCSLYFRQGVLIKSIVLMIGLFFGLTIMYNYILKIFFPGLDTHITYFFGDIYVSATKDSFYGAPKLRASDFNKYIFPWLILSVLWITARIRFNEIER